MNYLILKEENKQKIFEILKEENENGEVNFNTKLTSYETVFKAIKYIEDEYLQKLNQIRNNVEDRKSAAQKHYAINAEISINAYGTGYEKGILESMNELLEDIEEIQK